MRIYSKIEFSITKNYLLVNLENSLTNQAECK